MDLERDADTLLDVALGERDRDLEDFLDDCCLNEEFERDRERDFDLSLECARELPRDLLFGDRDGDL